MIYFIKNEDIINHLVYKKGQVLKSQRTIDNLKEVITWQRTQEEYRDHEMGEDKAQDNKADADKGAIQNPVLMMDQDTVEVEAEEKEKIDRVPAKKFAHGRPRRGGTPGN